MGVFDHIWLGVVAGFATDPAFTIRFIPISITVLMVFFGFLLGVIVGATPGLGGPSAMAISLPILISIFAVSYTHLTLPTKA